MIPFLFLRLVVSHAFRPSPGFSLLVAQRHCLENGHDVEVVEADLLQSTLICSLVVISQLWLQVLQLVENSYELLALLVVVFGFELSKQVLRGAH